MHLLNFFFLPLGLFVCLIDISTFQIRDILTDSCLIDLWVQYFNVHGRYFQAIPEAAPENEQKGGCQCWSERLNDLTNFWSRGADSSDSFWTRWFSSLFVHSVQCLWVKCTLTLDVATVVLVSDGQACELWVLVLLERMLNSFTTGCLDKKIHINSQICGMRMLYFQFGEPEMVIDHRTHKFTCSIVVPCLCIVG